MVLDVAPLIAKLSASEQLQLAAVIIASFAAVVSAIAARISIVNERKRTQPIVIAHEAHGTQFSEEAGHFEVGAYLENEGGGKRFQREIWS